MVEFFSAEIWVSVWRYLCNQHLQDDVAMMMLIQMDEWKWSSWPFSSELKSCWKLCDDAVKDVLFLWWCWLWWYWPKLKSCCGLCDDVGGLLQRPACLLLTLSSDHLIFCKIWQEGQSVICKTWQSDAILSWFEEWLFLDLGSRFPSCLGFGCHRSLQLVRQSNIFHLQRLKWMNKEILKKRMLNTSTLDTLMPQGSVASSSCMRIFWRGWRSKSEQKWVQNLHENPEEVRYQNSTEKSSPQQCSLCPPESLARFLFPICSFQVLFLGG